MHRHGYKGRKFGRETDQRTALMKGLAAELIKHDSITTTLPKAKDLVPYVEKLITKAKIGDLHNRRLIISKVANVESAHRLVDEIAPKLTARNSGHLRIERAGYRRGDNAVMATVSFVDSLNTAEPKIEENDSSKQDIKKDDKKAEVKKVVSNTKVTKQPAPKIVAKRTGVRGNK